MGDESKKARVRARMEHIASDETVMEKLDEYENAFIGKRKRSAVKLEMLRDVKREKREEAVNSASILYENDQKCKGV